MKIHYVGVREFPRVLKKYPVLHALARPSFRLLPYVPPYQLGYAVLIFLLLVKPHHMYPLRDSISSGVRYSHHPAAR